MPGTPKKAAAATNSPKSKESPSNKEKSSPGKNSPTKEVDNEAQAMEHFAQGKRNLLVNDINAAVNSLQEACRLLAEKYGETAPECGDAYFYYGRALLEMARMESDVLGNALDGVPEGDDLENSQVEDPDKLSAEEKEKVSDQVDDALQETTNTLEKKDKSSTKDKSEDSDKSKDKKDDAKDKKDDAAMDTDSKKEGEKDESQDEDGEEDDSQEEDEEEDGEDKDGEEEDEDVSNHQLAWEILELAKVIYQKQEEGNKEMSLKTAQVFLKLGEVGLESENYPQAIEDFQSCLKIQEKHMEKDDRCLAETHYQLGVAHSFSDQFDESIDSFTKALKIIEGRITNLEKNKEEKEAKESEIKELNNLIPEIKEKIEDMEEMKKDSKEKINKVKKELGMAMAIGGSSKENEGAPNAFGSVSSSSDAKPISTMMIKKKRKPEDEAEAETTKKTKAENGDAKPSETSAKNGHAENGVKNGHSSPEKMDTEKDTTDAKKKAKDDMEKKTAEIKDSA